ncbi:hypothetical protein [Fimbriimonas ginsengisoli]|nr:hypothetical protein [Fimbriimonas ginsengisoli]
MKTVLWVPCAMLAAMSSASDARVARLIRVDGNLAVRIKTRTLLLHGRPISTPARTFPKSVDPAKTFHDWLKDDERWGGHKEANELRYMDRNGGGVGAEYADFYEVKHVGTFAVMNLRYMGPSGEPTGPQILVRQRPGKDVVEWVRRLSELPSMLYRSPPKRIYEFKRRRYVLEGDGVYGLNPDGTAGKLFADIPDKSVPAGLADGRYIVFVADEMQGGNDQWVHALDLARGKSFKVIRIPSYEGGKPPPLYFADSYIGDSPYLIFSRKEEDPAVGRYFALHLPDGARRPIAKVLWPLGDYGIEEQTDRVLVYSLKSGRLVQTLPLPKARKS